MKVSQKGDILYRIGDSDSFIFGLKLKATGEDYPLQEGDTITFKIMCQKRPVALQEIYVTDFTEEGKAVIPLTPGTLGNIVPGDYEYLIKRTDEYGSVLTVFDEHDFTVIQDGGRCHG